MIDVYKIPAPTTNHQIQSREVIKCACCDKDLIELIVTTNGSNRLHKYQVKCPCGQESFIKKINGFANILPCDNLNIKSVVTTDITKIEVT